MVRNVEARIDDKANKLILTVDLSAAKREAATPSASGKTRTLGSTGGFVAIADVGYNLTVSIAK